MNHNMQAIISRLACQHRLYNDVPLRENVTSKMSSCATAFFDSNNEEERERATMKVMPSEKNT